MLGHYYTYSHLCPSSCVCLVRLPSYERTNLTPLHLNLSSVLFWDMVGLKKGNSIMMLRHITLGFLVMLFYLKTVFLHFKNCCIPSCVLYLVWFSYKVFQYKSNLVYTRRHAESITDLKLLQMTFCLLLLFSNISCFWTTPNRYDFSSHSSMPATLNSIFITSSSRQAIERECWQQAMNA